MLLGQEDPERFFSFILLRIHINSMCVRKNKSPFTILLKSKRQIWVHVVQYFFLTQRKCNGTLSNMKYTFNSSQIVTTSQAMQGGNANAGHVEDRRRSSRIK